MTSAIDKCCQNDAMLRLTIEYLNRKWNGNKEENRIWRCGWSEEVQQ